MKTYYTIYKVTNQINGKIYVGSHKTKDLNDSYMGSGKYLKRAQEKNGLENFTKEILFIFDTSEEMYKKEAEIVNEDFLTNENTYNLKIGGFGGWDYLNNDELFDNPTHSIEHCKRISPFGTKEFIESCKLNGSFSKAGLRSKELGVGIHDPKHRAMFTGKTHTADAKRKIGNKNSINQQGVKNSQFGTMWITDGTKNVKVKKGLPIQDGWRVGRIMKNVI